MVLWPLGDLGGRNLSVLLQRFSYKSNTYIPAGSSSGECTLENAMPQKMQGPGKSYCFIGNKTWKVEMCIKGGCSRSGN